MANIYSLLKETTPPVPSGVEIAASATAARASALLSSTTLDYWTNTTAKTAQKPTRAVIVPGWGSYYLTPVDGGWLSVHTKLGSGSYRALKPDGTHVNLKGSLPLPASDAWMEKGVYVFALNQEARDAAAQHVTVNKDAYNSQATLNGQTSVLDFPFLANGAWQYVDVKGVATGKIVSLPDFELKAANKAAKTEKKLGIAAAFVSDGKHVLVQQQEDMTWGLPFGVNDSPDSASNVVAKSFGSLPTNMVFSGITVTEAQKDKPPLVVSVFNITSAARKAYLPTSKLPWAWVPVGEIMSGDKGTTWSPTLSAGLSLPKTVEGAKTQGAASLLDVWADNAVEWTKHAKKAAKAAGVEASHIDQVKAGINSGLGFAGSLFTKNPRRHYTASRLRMNGNGFARSYHDKRTGSHVTVKALLHSSRRPVTSSADQPDWTRLNQETESFGGRLRLNPGDWAMLDRIGFTHERLGLRRRNPSGTLIVSKTQVSAIEGLHASLVSLLSSKPQQSWGTSAQKQLKNAIEAAIGAVKGPANDYEKNAKFLRYLVLARAAGLWPDILDPGNRPLFRGLNVNTPASGDPQANTKWGAFSWSPEGEEIASQTGSSSFWQAARAWVKQQRNLPGWKIPSGISLPSRSSGSQADPPSSWTELSYGKGNYVRPTPPWASEAWAQVKGFPFHWTPWLYTGPGYAGNKYDAEVLAQAQMINHWRSAAKAGYAAGSGLTVRALGSNPGFILNPTYTLFGKSMQSELEVIYVTNGEPLPAEIVKLSGNLELLDDQVRAYTYAHPAYPQDIHKNPRRNAPVTTAEADGKVCTLVFSDDNFSTTSSARRWAKQHGYSAQSFERLNGYTRIRVKSASAFLKGSFRKVELAPGVTALVGELR
jgi:hypothetical protein